MGNLSAYGRIAALAAVVVVIAACAARLPEEERVRQAVLEAAEAVRGKDVRGFMSLVSRDYNDDAGNTYDGVKGIIFYQLMRPGAVRVFLRGLEVKVDGDTALVNAKAFIIRASGTGAISDVLPENAEGLRFSVVMRKEDGQWRALSAGWDEVGVLGVL